LIGIFAISSDVFLWARLISFKSHWTSSPDSAHITTWII
jgi:hypothetical protein